MSDYSKTTNFGAKDALPTGNAAKVIKGSEHDTEYDNIATMSATKANKIAAPTDTRIVTMDANGDIQDGGNATLVAGVITAVGFTGPLTGNVTGSADTLTTGRTISLTGDVTGTSAAFDGSANASIAASLAASSVAQGELKTTTGEVSTTAVISQATAPGGEYGFLPVVRSSSAATTMTGMVHNYTTVDITGVDTPSTLSATYVATLTLGENSATSKTIYAKQRYIQASPPYDLGDGEIPLFVFATIDNTTSEIESIYSATEAPWHYNGPTSITPDAIIDGVKYKYKKNIPENIKSLPLNERIDILLNEKPQLIEITQDIKNKDMDIVPHPFILQPLAGKTVVMLDPVCDCILNLRELMEDGESVNEILHEKYIKIGNSDLKRSKPNGVMVPSISWKRT